MYDHVRVCRDCGEEYRPGVVRCADCGGELEDRYPGQEQAPAPAAEPPPAAELEGYRVLYETTRATDLMPMTERLREGGIDHRLAELPPVGDRAPTRYVIVVRDGEATRALAAVGELIAPHEEGADVHAVESRYDPERGYVQCPACGASPPPGAAECPECGLGLGGGEPGEDPRE